MRHRQMCMSSLKGCGEVIVGMGWGQEVKHGFRVILNPVVDTVFGPVRVHDWIANNGLVNYKGGGKNQIPRLLVTLVKLPFWGPYCS